MGWLFGKKKVLPKVPFPAGHEEEGALRFPSFPSSEKVIEPEELKEAAGIEEEILPFQSTLPKKGKAKGSFFRKVMSPEPIADVKRKQVPTYVRLEVYKEVLGELDGLKSNLTHLQMVTGHLQSSEYNEENRFVKLRRAMRGIHDRLLQVDKILFKGE